MKKILAVSLVVLLNACTAITPVVSKTETIRRPELNVVRTEELGNTLVTFIYSTSKPSIQIPAGAISKGGPEFQSQVLRPLGAFGERFNKYSFDLPPTGYNFPEICFDKQQSIFFIPNGLGVCDSIGSSAGALRDRPVVDVKPATYVDTFFPQLRQELIYNGKSGTTVKFTYREISGGYMRTPFTQEIQYDLEAGPVIGFKGARIEIIKSTNQLIEYRVQKYFDPV